MLKKIFLVSIIAFSVFLGLRSTASAQKYHAKPKAAPEATEEAEEGRPGLTEAQLEDMEKTNREILRKLDLILSNQERILKELEIVKIRASKK